MKPRSSASGTKTAGETKPRSGSIQRARRLEADDAVVAKPNDRLKMHINGVVDDGIAQRLFELRRALHFLGDLAGIHSDLAAAATLGAIKRGLALFMSSSNSSPAKG